MRICERTLNALWILVICAVLCAGFWVQIFDKEIPCPLCMLQRIGMISVASAALLNLTCGVKTGHYSLALLSCLFGASVSLRQIALHVCPQFDTFGTPVFGLSLFTWAFIVFCCSIVAVAFLMFFYDPKESSREPVQMNWLDKFVGGLLLLVTVGNFFSAIVICGFGPCD